MSTMMTDDHGSANGAHGGVGHLLRMAKTQCGGSLAFAALRKADGGFAIATFPTLSADPTWSVEAIDELVRQTWDDPHLTGGSVLVRSGRVLKSMWTGQGHHIKLAAAPLSDPEAPDRPWGLLCVAEPLAGHFEQDQLNLLANLAVRLTSYLRARQRVLEGSLSFETETVAPQPAEPLHEPFAADWNEGPAAPSQPHAPRTIDPYLTAAPTPSFDEPSDFDDLYGAADADEHPLDRAADAFGAASEWGPRPGAAAKADDWEFLGLDEIEWVEAVAPAAPFAAEEVPVAPNQPAEAPPAGPDAPHPPTDAFFAREAGPSATEGLEALLAPDPETGLATLTTLVGRLSSSLARAANNEGTVGLILVEVSTADGGDTLTRSALMTVAGRLTNHLRDRDLVARIGPSLFAVLVDLRPGAIELESIRARTIDALTAGVDSSTGGLRARSALALAESGSSTSAEVLLRQAADELLGR